MTKKELREMAVASLQPGTIGRTGYVQGFEACYRLLTTLRPMSEAPRDGTNALLWTVQGQIRYGHWLHTCWVIDGVRWEDHRLAGWLPIWTPIEDNANG